MRLCCKLHDVLFYFYAMLYITIVHVRDGNDHNWSTNLFGR